MVKLEIDVIKPNLQVRDYESMVGPVVGILYSLERAKDVVKSARVVNGIVGRHIDEKGLKIMESDYEFINGENPGKRSGTFSFPLDKYLNSIDGFSGIKRVVLKEPELFGVTHIISSFSAEHEELTSWFNLKNDLADPQKAFDRMDGRGIIRIDREKSLENMKKLFEELDSKMLNQSAGLNISPIKYRDNENYFGFISLKESRKEGKEKVKLAKDELVEKLKEFDGPCLSLDAFELYMQCTGIRLNANALVSNYGDILLNPNWPERFFRFDP
ncbi:MAG: hypothetical protein Q7S27_03805 [Nanoarchaeota archaeon]|nr:hypothetical protein [Nanoarchaeota archaeon]